MKANILLALLVLIFYACASETDRIEEFIPGTYARFSDHEMRTEYDTLIILKLSQAGNSYELIRASRFRKKLDLKIFPWEYKNENWTAVFDDSRKVLMETKKGKLISFVPEKKILLVGTTEYKKIK